MRRRGCCRWRRLSAGEVDDQELDEARLRETLAEVAGIGAGADIINDVSGLEADPMMESIAVDTGGGQVAGPTQR